MSTEAKGDGHTDAVGTVAADLAAGGAEPQVTAADQVPDETPASAEASAADGPGEADDEPPEDYGDYADDDAPAYDDYDDDDDGSEYGNGSDYDEISEREGALEYDEGYEDYEEPGEYEGAYGEPEGYADPGEYEQEEVPGPRRARRWPRVLLAGGFVVLAAAIVGGAIAIVGSVTHGFTKPVKVTYTKSALFSLKTGQCFDPQGQSYTLIPCNSPHVAEVFGTFTLSGSAWPGDTAVAAAASSGCATRLTGYLNPQLAISLSQAYVYPDSVAWQAGTRTVICEVRATTGDLTGSVRGASATAG